MSRRKYEGKISVGRRVLIYLGRFFLWLILTVLVLVLGLYQFLYLINKGPSNHFRDLFVVSAMESSAGGILAQLYLSDEEIAEIQERNRTVETTEITDVSLITIESTDQSGSQLGSQGEDEVSFVYDDPGQLYHDPADKIPFFAADSSTPDNPDPCVFCPEDQ